MKASILFMAALLFLTACNKTTDSIIEQEGPTPVSDQFIRYTIRNGQHYCDNNQYRTMETEEMKFVVKFDSSAIYETRSAENQYDINKLFGFSDNNKDHHQYSARFGWRWSDHALRLFAYVYNEGLVSSKELCAVPIGQELTCSLKTKGGRYLFYVNDAEYEMPRLSTTEKAKGYQLYPYFGGDEVAPHEINIWIKAL